MSRVISAGKFSIDTTTMVLTGPLEYMAARGNAVLEDVMGGTCRGFNAVCQFSPSVETAILVYLQTDYAAWLGFQGWLGMMPRGVS